MNTHLRLCVSGETEGKFCIRVCEHSRRVCVHSSVPRGSREKVLRVLKILRKNLATAHTTGWYTFNACEAHFLY